MPSGIARPPRPAFDDEMKARIAATIARACLVPVDPGAPNLIQRLADIFRQRAMVGWTTLLSPETTILVAEALDAYAPKPPEQEYRDPDARFSVNVFKSGSAIYRLDRDGEIFEVAAWAKSTSVARSAFDRLLEQYPNDRFMQKRRSWVERE
jgi:hypothetical protein